MTEKDLIDLGFDKFEQNDEEDRFYYYCYDLNGESGCGSLISDSDDTVVDGNWKVYAWDINENLVFDNKEDIKTYIKVIEKNILTKEL
jgi:hypothetical protein